MPSDNINKLDPSILYIISSEKLHRFSKKCRSQNNLFCKTLIKIEEFQQFLTKREHNKEMYTLTPDVYNEIIIYL